MHALLWRDIARVLRMCVFTFVFLRGGNASQEYLVVHLCQMLKCKSFELKLSASVLSSGGYKMRISSS